MTQLAWCLILEQKVLQPQVPNGTVDIAVEMEAQTELSPNPASMSLEPTPCGVPTKTGADT